MELSRIHVSSEDELHLLLALLGYVIPRSLQSLFFVMRTNDVPHLALR